MKGNVNRPLKRKGVGRQPTARGLTIKEMPYFVKLWLGPAPLRNFNENHFHYQWHWFWNYGGGDLANDGVHQIDLARWAINRTLPKAVSSTGATHAPSI